MKIARPIRKRPATLPAPRGAALLVSLLLISSMAGLALILFQAIRLEERTGAAFAENFRARQAVSAGLETIRQKLLSAQPTSEGAETAADYLVIRPVSDRQGVVAASFQDGKWTYQPLFSGAAQVTPSDTLTAPNITLTDRLPAALRAAVQTHYENITGESSLGAAADDELYPASPFWEEEEPEAGWEYVEFPDSDPVNDNREVSSRALLFTYTTEDLGAYVNAATAGNDRGTGNSHVREYGVETDEIALFTVLDDLLPGVSYNDPSSMAAAHKNTANQTQSARVIAARKTGSVDLDALFPYDPSKPDTESANQLAITARRSLVTTPAGAENEVPLVPRGFGYPDEGLPKKDLNEFVRSGDVDGLAAYISRNLPSWKDRSTKIHPDYDYVKSIAANIIDYADDDQDSTSGSGYRGLDSFPLVNKFYDRYSYFDRPDHTRLIVEMESWVELWNQSNQVVNGHVEIRHNNRRGVNGFAFAELTTPVFDLGTLTLQPNEFRVIKLGATNYELTFTPPFTAPTTGSPLTFQSTPANTDPELNTTYKLYWNGELVDFCRGGFQNSGFTFPQLAYTNQNSSKSNWRWLGMANPHLHISGGQVGDPRASVYIHGTDGLSGSESYTHHRTYTSNVCWGSRNVTTTGTNDYRTVFPALWPDAALNLKAVGPTAGTYATSPLDGARPSQISALQKPGLFVSRFSNLGHYERITELANVFDPVHWRGLNKNDGPLQVAGTKSCGGATLRVGRTEHAPFRKDGFRASELMNLFHVDLNPERPRQGLVNINTATRDTLRALFAGVPVKQDESALSQHDSILPASYTANYAIYPPSQTLPADLIADAIIAARKTAPFRSLSDLSDAARPGSGNASERGVFGNPALWPTSSASSGNAPMLWQTLTGESAASASPGDDQDVYGMSDAAREEIFDRTAALVTTTSRSFRVRVTGMSAEKRRNTWRITGTASQSCLLTVTTANGATDIQIYALDTP